MACYNHLAELHIKLTTSAQSYITPFNAAYCSACHCWACTAHQTCHGYAAGPGAEQHVVSGTHSPLRLLTLAMSTMVPASFSNTMCLTYCVVSYDNTWITDCKIVAMLPAAA